ncbi:MAG: zinc metallopeptidase [Saprospirales bacterium]|nr:MAG: zinc metallopeptidase [Saprospirales bacterium]
MGEYMAFIVVAGVFSVIGWLIQNRLKRVFSHYSQIGLRSGLTGAEVAERMLRHYNINDVRVVPGKGFLTDHYNPTTKTVSLSEAVYSSRSISAAAVAAHECGHAVQHATAYPMLQMRSKLVPVVQVAAGLQQYLLLAALLFLGTFPQLLLIVIASFAATTLFSLVTLPVEFDASKRALKWLERAGITSGDEQRGAKTALWWAAMTYVAAALASFVMLLYLVFRYMQNR